VIAGACALVVLAYFGILTPLLVLRAGYPATAAWLAITSLAYAGFLGAVAAAPATMQRALSGRTRLDLTDAGHVIALVLVVSALEYVFGNGLANGIYALEATLRHVPQPDVTLTAGDVVLNIVVNVAVFVLPVLFYVSFVGRTGPSGALRELGLAPEGAGRQMIVGLLVAAGFLAALIAASALLSRFVDIPENQRALDIARGLDVASALVVAAGAAVSEEVFFRGFLLPRVGLVGQALLFSAAHLSYVNALEIVVTLALGRALGLLRRRTGSLWGPIATHFAFDFLELMVAIYAPTST
jgi:membrane protease YdiL (CAAX protease family)